jgi:hypothetical protein
MINGPLFYVTDHSLQLNLEGGKISKETKGHVSSVAQMTLEMNSIIF